MIPMLPWTLCSAVLTAVAIRPAMTCARRWGAVDRPDVRRLHRHPTPRLGGLALFTALGPVLILGLVHAARTTDSSTGPLLGVVIGTTSMFVLGLWDDLRGLGAEAKLLVQVLAASVAWMVGLRVEVIPFGPFHWTLGELSGPVTVLWLLAVTNALNLIDGLDGLASGIAAITAGVLAALAGFSGLPILAAWMIGLAGCLLVFLCVNTHPARIFLGDSGSLMLGFLLAAAAIQAAQTVGTFAGHLLPIAALALPLFDTVFSMLRRAAQRRSLFAADCAHIHHRLLARGYSPRRAAGFAWLICLASVLVAAAALYCTPTVGLFIAAGLGIAHVLLFRWIGAIRWRQTWRRLRQNRLVARQVRAELERFEALQLYFQRATTFTDWWQAVCRAGRSMRFAELTLALQRRDGTTYRLFWSNPEPVASSRGDVTFMVGLRDRRSGPPLQMAIKAPVTGDLESVGRRVMLFGRLIEPFHLAAAETDTMHHDVSPPDATGPGLGLPNAGQPLDIMPLEPNRVG